MGGQNNKVKWYASRPSTSIDARLVVHWVPSLYLLLVVEYPVGIDVGNGQLCKVYVDTEYPYGAMSYKSVL